MKTSSIGPVFSCWIHVIKKAPAEFVPEIQRTWKASIFFLESDIWDFQES